MTTRNVSYRVLVDWDRDGYFCADTQYTDALNLLPTPLTNIYIAPRTNHVSASVVSTRQFGNPALFEITTGDSAGRGAIFGVDEAMNATRIKVLPEAIYTIAWQGASITPSDYLRVEVRDQANTLLAVRSETAMGVTFAQYSLTFTTENASQYIKICFVRDISGSANTHIITELMLVAGVQAPSAFNTGSTSNAYDNISGDVVNSIAWQWGISEAFQDFARPATATLTIANLDDTWLPENENSPLYGFFKRGTLVRIECAVNGTGNWQPEFIGSVKSITVGSGFDEYFATLHLEDSMLMLLNAEYVPDLFLNKRTDQILQAVVDDALLSYPYPAAMGIFDASSFDMTVFRETVETEFDEGATTLAFAGDNSGTNEGVNAQGFLREVIAAEMGGRFFYNPKTSKYAFHSRLHDLLQPGAQINLATTKILWSSSPVYSYGDDVINDASISFVPRELGSAGTVIYKADMPRVIRSGGEVISFVVRYHAPNNPSARVGAINVLQPLVPFVDYSANEAQDGTGADRTNNIEILIYPSANSAEVKVRNNAGVNVYLIFSLRGTPLISLPIETVMARSVESVALNGYQKTTRQITMLNDREQAQSYANLLVSSHQNPSGTFRNISLEIGASSDPADALMAFGLNIGDRVIMPVNQLSPTQTSTSTVIGFYHKANITAGRHTVTLVLEPTARNAGGIFDDPLYGIFDEGALFIF